MASGERGEAASGVVRSVLKEDVMLGLGSGVWHGCGMHGTAPAKFDFSLLCWDVRKTNFCTCEYLLMQRAGEHRKQMHECVVCKTTMHRQAAQLVAAYRHFLKVRPTPDRPIA